MKKQFNAKPDHTAEAQVYCEPCKQPVTVPHMCPVNNVRVIQFVNVEKKHLKLNRIFGGFDD